MKTDVFLGVLSLTLVVPACIFFRIEPQRLEPAQVATQSPPEIRTPAKAHLKNGGVVLFADGFRIEAGSLRGRGGRYDLTRQSYQPVEEVSLDEVAAMEHYERDVRALPTLAATTSAVVIDVVGIPLLLVAIFGSCPTVYSIDADRTLEAELFSHSITRRFEADDVDRLDTVGLRNGGYRLQVANEALETHYLNRLALQTVDHPAGTRAYPSPEGEILVFAGDVPFSARSRAGEDLTGVLARRDGVPYRSDPALVRRLGGEITEDWLEMAVPIPPEARGKDLLLGLRVRNTLMATVLFYDLVLREQGIRALEWLGEGTGGLLSAWRTYRWFTDRYGLRVQAWDGDRFADVSNVRCTGPIAWHEVAVRLPAVEGPVARVRLSFLPDNWMVDWATFGFGTERPRATSTIAPAGVEGLVGREAEKKLALLRESDRDYLVTAPGESYVLFFPSGPPPPGIERTCFLRSRGFYIEWLRGEWLAGAGTERTKHFEPGDAAVMRNARLWLERKEELERRFAEARIPLSGGAQ